MKEGEVAIYDKLLDQMPGCWNLTKDEFIYMPELSSSKLVHVRFERGEVTSVKEFQLPDGVSIKSPISANLDLLVESQKDENK